MTLKKYANGIFGYITKQSHAVTINATTQHVNCYGNLTISLMHYKTTA